jgi:hypothetical protein
VERCAFRDSGVDDQQVDWAVEGSRFVECIADLIGCGDIAAQGNPAMALGNRLERLEPASEQRQLGPGRTQMLRGSGANSRASARDKRVTTGQRRLCHALPSLVFKHWPNRFEVARRRR